MDASEYDGVKANRTEAARVFSVSLPTLDRWIAAGMPVDSDGTNGRAYEIDMGAALRWRQGQEQAERDRDAQRKEKLDKLQAELDLRGGASAVDELPFKARQEYFESELRRSKVLRERAELVESAAVLRVMESLTGAIADRLQSLPDLLERRCALEPDTVDEIGVQVTEWQSSIRQELDREMQLLMRRADPMSRGEETATDDDRTAGAA